MKDRFYNGFLSGIIAGILGLTFNVSAKALGFTPTIWADYMSLFIMGKRPDTIIQTVFFIIAQFIFMGVLGAIFAYLAPLISSKHLVFKGVIYGAIVWFILQSIPFLLQIPELKTESFDFVVVSLIGVIIWGIVMALILNRLDHLN